MKSNQDPTILYLTLFILIIIVIIVINYHEDDVVKEGFSPCDVDIANAFALPSLIDFGASKTKGVGVDVNGLGLNVSCCIS